MKKLFLLGLSLISTFFLFSQSPGTLDQSFGDNGYKLIDFGGTGNFCYGSDIQEDQKIVMAGLSFNDTRDISFARLNTDGSLDVGFGSNGIITFVFGGSEEEINDVLIQPDGKILAVGYTCNDGNCSMILTRLTQIGLMDPSFSNDGMVVVDFGPAYESFGYSLCLQDDDKILAIGYVRDLNMDIHCALCRINANGSMDYTFGTNGIVIMNFQSSENYMNNIMMQGDNILVGGVSYHEGDYYLHIARFNSTGLLDASFGNNGLSTTLLTMESVVLSARGDMCMDDEGHILYGTYFTGDLITAFAVYRFQPEGDPDLAFGDLGLAIAVLEDDASISAITTQYDGKILAGGSTPGGYALVRFLNDGNLDPAFGTDGNGIVYNYDLNRIYSLNIQQDGLIVAAGNAYAGNGSDFCAARYYSGLNVGMHDTPAGKNEILVTPNPFADMIKIQFKLTEEGQVKAEIYNVHGELLETLGGNQYFRGTHQLEWNANKQGSGLYLLKLTINDVVYTAKMVKEQ